MTKQVFEAGINIMNREEPMTPKDMHHYIQELEKRIHDLEYDCGDTLEGSKAIREKRKQEHWKLTQRVKELEQKLSENEKIINGFCDSIKETTVEENLLFTQMTADIYKGIHTLHQADTPLETGFKIGNYFLDEATKQLSLIYRDLSDPHPLVQKLNDIADRIRASNVVHTEYLYALALQAILGDGRYIAQTILVQLRERCAVDEENPSAIPQEKLPDYGLVKKIHQWMLENEGNTPQKTRTLSEYLFRHEQARILEQSHESRKAIADYLGFTEKHLERAQSCYRALETLRDMKQKPDL